MSDVRTTSFVRHYHLPARRDTDRPAYPQQSAKLRNLVGCSRAVPPSPRGPGCFPSMSPDTIASSPTSANLTTGNRNIRRYPSAVGECWEIEASVHERQKVRLVRHGSCRCRALGWAAMGARACVSGTRSRSCQVDDRGLDSAARTARNSAHIRCSPSRVVSPEAMFNGAVTGPDANSDQVVEIASGIPSTSRKTGVHQGRTSGGRWHGSWFREGQALVEI